MMKRSVTTILVLLILALVLGGCGGDKPATSGQGAEQNAGPRKGGVLKVALNSSPPTLDYQTTTAGLTKKVAWHIFETLYTLDKDYKVVPMLAEGLPQISQDGKTWTIKLRRNVPFHNGTTMKADDVIASLTRWGEIAPNGRALFSAMDSLAKKDDYTIEFQLKRPYGLLLEALANPDQAAAIMPESVVKGAGKTPVKDFIGTGPYKFAEWKPDQYIKLVRFDNYAARSEEASGLGGKKVAYLDEIDFIPVKDESVRTDGVTTGEYHVADIVPADAYERLKDNQNLQLVVEKPFRWIGGVFNLTKPPFDNLKARQAVLAAVNDNDVLAAAIGPQPFWRLDPGISFIETPYHNQAAKELYNQHNLDQAKKLLQEAGYNGQPVVLLTTKDYPYMYKTALVTKANLEAVGMKVDLQVYDWATVTSRRADKTKWDMFFTGFLFTVDPTGIPFMNAKGTWPGWYKSNAMAALNQEFQAKTTMEERKSVAEKMQKLFYEEVPVVKYGDAFEFVVLNKAVKGYRNMIDITFWNTWLEK